ncbi:MAG: arabinan endo-1,5-alpha-L-arabinosidase, partial [Bacteroidota bacterium]
MMIRALFLIVLLNLSSCLPTPKEIPTENSPITSGNPIFLGWYADPEGMVLDDQYWIFPTYSDDYDKQLHLDAFSSPDLVHWTKHENVLDT